MKIIGIMMQRDELDIVLFNVLHHLRHVGFDQLILGDNGSTDGSLEALRRLSEIEPRLLLVDVAGPYDQARRINSLYQLALEKGADWVVPIDADEFISVHRDALQRTLAECSAPAIRVGVRNFVQSRDVSTRDPSAIANIRFFARPRGAIPDAECLVKARQIGFIESNYPGKYIWRANANLRIHKGNHGGDGVGSLPAKSRVKLYHAPLRSKSDITKRKERIGRLDTGNPAKSWHIRRLGDLTEQQIAEEWEMNSARWGTLRVNGRLRLLRFSPFFPKLVRRYMSDIKPLLDP